MFLFNRKSVVKYAAIFSLFFMVGCSEAKKSLNSDTNKVKNEVNNISNSNKTPSNNLPNNNSPGKNMYQNSSNQGQQKNTSQNVLLGNIRTFATKGRIINCEYPVKDTNLSTIEKRWGKADNSTWVSSAKGLYSTYKKHNVVFGSNKGAQIFEARSLDPRLTKISLSMVKMNFGNPQHNVTTGGEQIIGYAIGKEFKLLFVFPKPTKSNPNPSMRHYSVLYPAGTVNSMAGDPGRQW